MKAFFKLSKFFFCQWMFALGNVIGSGEMTRILAYIRLKQIGSSITMNPSGLRMRRISATAIGIFNW